MSVETNKAAIRRFFEEVLPAGDVDGVDALVGSAIVDHNPTPGQPAGAAGIRHVVRTLHGAHVDLRVTVDDLVGEGDRVAARWTLRGIQTGPLFGVPPSGGRVEASAFVIFRFADGKVVERWGTHHAWSSAACRRAWAVPDRPEAPCPLLHPLADGLGGNRMVLLDATTSMYVHSG